MPRSSDELTRAERETEIFKRLHRLTARGYVAKLSEHGGVDDAVYLDHLASAPALILYSDGEIIAHGGEAINPRDKEAPNRIPAETFSDIARFNAFIATVPTPTWRQRTAPDREKYIYQPGCTVLFFGGLWLASYLLSKLFGD